MEKKSVKLVKNDSLVSIQVSGSFYRMVQSVLLYITSLKPSEELTELIDKINNEVSSDDFNEWEQAVETLMILCSEIESRAIEQEAVDVVEIEIPNEPPPPANL